MSINNRYVSQKTVWASQEEELVAVISSKLDSEGLIKDYEHKRNIKYVIAEELEEYILFRKVNYSKTGQFGWRVLYSLLVIFQWVLWPYCFYRWLTTGNFRVNSKSKLGVFIDRIVVQATH